MGFIPNERNQSHLFTSKRNTVARYAQATTLPDK
jgi:hypothetical protein